MTDGWLGPDDIDVTHLLAEHRRAVREIERLRDETGRLLDSIVTILTNAEHAGVLGHVLPHDQATAFRQASSTRDRPGRKPGRSPKQCG